ncbi:GHKL domain-containing protein [Clostridium sp. 'deep sea']|uniref:HAMP domain-containing sensor histidine kinase n=1 Tax=Clostridium sp. 'deep sea' TaxID=2779445 RepID=UPI001896A535|nr:ATP-binding protein [Clostridium sp. 'deep sea']QOR34715.1 GHKL domain-containing protein [Clostridium sp. 'deep sea']
MLAQPLIKINEAVAKITDLQFQTNISIHHKDELGELGHNLNLLSKKLKITINQLENELNKNTNLLKQQQELIDDLSHEIKTPLSIITAYTQAIKDNINPQLNNAYLCTILSEVTKINSLLVKLLNISAYESGVLNINAQSFDLVELVEEIAGRILIDQSLKELNIICNLPQSIFIKADKDLLAKALTNLVLNAYLYVDENNTIKITIKNENNTVLFELYNSCEFISNEQLKNIWKRFYRIDKSRSKNTGGSGLGLSTVYHILKLHNYQFTAKYKNNGFHFSLII